MKTRKVLSVLLAVVMVLSILPVAAVSSSAYSSYTIHTSDDGMWKYQLSTDGRVSLMTYLGTDGNITVPAKVDGYPVDSVWYATFDGLEGDGRQVPVSVTFSEGITDIKEGTFRSCANLKEVILPDSIRHIGKDAFIYSGLYNNKSNWEDGLLYVGKYLVASDSEISGDITVKDGTILVADEAFKSRREITSVSFPDTLKAIGENALLFCSSLEEISLPDSLEIIGAGAFTETAYYNNGENWEDGLLYIDSYLLDAENVMDSVVEVKEDTTLIGTNAFVYTEGIEKIVLPDSVIYVNDGAFANSSSLKSVKLSDNVRSIGNGVFSDNPELKSVTVPDTIVSFGIKVFQNCPKLERVVLGKGVTYISDDEFYNCPSLKSVTLPETLLVIGDLAFRECSKLKSIYLPDSLTSIGESPFCAYIDLPEEGLKKVWSTTLEVIYGHIGTFAESYAREHSIRFIEAGTFPDVSTGEWFFEAAKYNFEHGFITGYSNYNFGPADKLQRQDFIVILARIAGVDLDSYDACALSDVDINAYYGKSVAWAVANDIIKGYENGKFGVGDAITREQVATILYRYMGSPEVTGAEETLAPFADAGSISSFAQDAMVWAIQNGVISGKNATTLAPTATASRAEIATIIMRMDKANLFD